MSWSCRASTAALSSISPKRVRYQSSAAHFYQNRQLELYASKEAKRLTLRQLVFFGRSMDAERLIKSANYVRTEIPVRLAHRLRDLQALPYIVVTQEDVRKVYELYWTAFDKFRRYPPITNITENEKFCDFLKGVLEEHGTVIPNLSLGLSLSSPHLPPETLDSFMRRMLVSRISRRVLAEHHIALSNIHAGRGNESSGDPHVGIIFTGLSLKMSIDKCTRLLRERTREVGSEGEVLGEWPEVIVDGHLDTKFAYIREHLEYIVFELLKNSMRATVLKYKGREVPPINATIVQGENEVGIRISDQGGGLISPQIKQPSDLFSFSHIRNSARMDNSMLGALRAAGSRPGGIVATVREQVNWHMRRQSQPNRQENGKAEPEMASEDHPEIQVGLGPHQRIGIGLPMSNIFANYFGGSLELVSMDGWGTDVYLRLPKLGTNLEDIEV